MNIFCFILFSYFPPASHNINHQNLFQLFGGKLGGSSTVISILWFSSWKLFQLDKTLQNIYSYLQRFAVGLEEIVLDQALFDGEFIQEFNEAEYKLKAVSRHDHDIIIGRERMSKECLSLHSYWLFTSEILLLQLLVCWCYHLPWWWVGGGVGGWRKYF